MVGRRQAPFDSDFNTQVWAYFSVIGRMPVHPPDAHVAGRVYLIERRDGNHSIGTDPSVLRLRCGHQACA